MDLMLIQFASNARSYKKRVARMAASYSQRRDPFSLRLSLF